METSQSLREVVLLNVSAYDRDYYAARLLEVVYARDSKLTKFCFSFSEPTKGCTYYSYELTLHFNRNIKHLDVQNNLDFQHKIRLINIVSRIPNVNFLNIIESPVELMNSINHNELKTLKISKIEDDYSILDTIQIRPKLNLTIKNSPVTGNSYFRILCLKRLIENILF